MGDKMIYITGDCHGDYRRFNTTVFPEQKEMTKKDYVIVCGDFGFWDESAEQRYWRKWLESKPFTTLWIDGNHENYDLLSQQRVSQWHGGNVQKISPSVIHLMRGQIYEIEGRKVFTFGGARSHDISGGILEPDDPEYQVKKKRLDRQKSDYRVNHLSWWKEEMPNEAEFEEGRRNLEKNYWEVDYIITHCCASSTQALFSQGVFKPDSLTDYLEEIKKRCRFQKWFFGHYHDNQMIGLEEIMIYEQIIRIA